jgi:hypothetical protein
VEGGGAVVTEGVPAPPQAPTNRIVVIVSVDLKCLEGVTSGWYEPQCVTVPVEVGQGSFVLQMGSRPEGSFAKRVGKREEDGGSRC